MTLTELNRLDRRSATQAFTQCCAARRWVSSMVNALPFSEEQSVYLTANRAWKDLQEEDYLQAFQAHPQIGDMASLHEKYASSKALAANEQAAVLHTDEHVLKALAADNARYLQTFGFIFIVCATGKNAEEMLAILRSRLLNSRAEELQSAAEEQRKITLLRLQQMLHVPESECLKTAKSH